MLIRKHLWRGLGLLTVIALLLPLATPGLAAPLAQGGDPATRAQNLLDQMTPQERVGQLFLVTFNGAEMTEESPIYDLVTRYHIGGVVLQRELDNFLAMPDTLEQAYDLISALQRAASDASSLSLNDPVTREEYSPGHVPLLVGISQEGDGHPNDQILEGLSPQPNAMTLGATWAPDLAERAGDLLGRELSALGINLLLGPSLDVLEDPQPGSASDLGVASFGGDPFWVGEMGQAYVQGLHAGSEGQMAVIAKHLPGYGSSDRPLDEEIPTIRKSLNQLIQIELPPFFSVTGLASTESSQVEGMLLSHIRYLGFQGNIRASTEPVSFDPQAFSELMGLPAFGAWRAAGGLVISDKLGTRAVRRHYDPSEQEFNAALVALDAFLAGNDMLYLDDFVATDDPDSYTTIANTAEFFAQKYREDAAFAQRVDESVLRILTLKFNLYSSFDLLQVVPTRNGLSEIGQDTETIFEIGRRAATLLSPSASDLPSVLPETPGTTDRIIFVSDSYSALQCADCPSTLEFNPNAVRDAVLQLYGPDAGDQIVPSFLSAFTFEHLAEALALNPEAAEDNALLINLGRADWVIFSMLDVSDSRASSLALQSLLSERPDLIADKRVVLFAFNAPYYLDATDITKITAYYGLYNKQAPMAEIAARLLFREISAPGASPITINGAGYDLIEATSPDPDRVIPLHISQVLILLEGTATAEPTVQNLEPSPTPEATEAPAYRAGDVLRLEAGPILDHNGHHVPDNTPVTFYINLTSEGNRLERQVSANTVDGRAEASYSIEAEGSLDIWASSGDPAANAEIRHFDVVGINIEGIALQATQTALAILQLTPPALSTAEALAAAEAQIHDQTNLSDWFVMGIVALLGALFAYQVGLGQTSMRWAIRRGLISLVGGGAAGAYLSLDLPGAAQLLKSIGTWGVMLVVAGGCVLGWLAALGWQRSDSNKAITGDLSSPPD